MQITILEEKRTQFTTQGGLTVNHMKRYDDTRIGIILMD